MIVCLLASIIILVALFWLKYVRRPGVSFSHEWRESGSRDNFVAFCKAKFKLQGWRIHDSSSIDYDFLVAHPRTGLLVRVEMMDPATPAMSMRSVERARQAITELNSHDRRTVLVISNLEKGCNVVAYAHSLGVPMMHHKEFDVVLGALRAGHYTGDSSSWLYRLFFNDPSLCVSQSLALLNKGDFLGAIRWGERAVSLSPSNPVFCDHLGGLHLRDGSFDIAKELVQRAIEENPDSDELLFKMSEIEAGRGDLNAAVDWGRKALTLRPTSARLFDHLASLHMRQGMFDDAERVIKDAVARNPGMPSLLRRMSQIRTSLGDLDGALKWAREALAVEPTNVDLSDHLASVHVQHGMLDEAERIVKEALRRNPGTPSLLRRLSQIKATRVNQDANPKPG